MPQAKTVDFLKNTLNYSEQEIATIGDYADTAIHTLEVLKNDIGCGTAVIKKFLEYAHRANLTLDNYFLGKVDRPKYNLPEYNGQQQHTNVLDLKKLIAIAFANTQEMEHPTYFATAGAPGLLHAEYLHQRFAIQTSPSLHLPNNAVYLSPDDFVMPNMEQYAALKNTQHKNAYKQTRDAANWITAVMHGLAVIRRRNIIHDTTSSSPICKTIHAALNEAEYEIRLALLFGDKSLKTAVLENSTHGQVIDSAEAAQKSSNVFARMDDLYFERAATVSICWVEKPTTDALPTFIEFASYEHNKEPSIHSEQDEDGMLPPTFKGVHYHSFKVQKFSIDGRYLECWAKLILQLKDDFNPEDEQIKLQLTAQIGQWPSTTPFNTPPSSRPGSPLMLLQYANHQDQTKDHHSLAAEATTTSGSLKIEMPPRRSSSTPDLVI